MSDTEEGSAVVSIELRFSPDCPRSLLGEWLRNYEKVLDAAKLTEANNRKKKRTARKQQNRFFKAHERWNRIHSKISPYFSIAGIPDESESSLSSEEYDSSIKNPSKDI